MIERLDTLREYRAYAERAIDSADGILKVEHLKPHHTDAVRRRRDAARLAAHYSAQIERLELCTSLTISPTWQAASHQQNFARLILLGILRWLNIASVP